MELDEILAQGIDDLGDFLRCFFAHFSLKKEVFKILISSLVLKNKREYFYQKSSRSK